MGLSIANTMSPFMGRGAPMTVIKGGFALGLTRSVYDLYKLYFASRLKLNGLATSSTGFSFQIRGRDGLGYYNSSENLTEITKPTHYDSWSDFDGLVRISSTPDGGYYEGSSEDGLIAAEEAAHSVRGDLGTVIAPNVRIVLYGKLDSLSVHRIAQAGLSGPYVSTSIWSNKYKHRWPDGTVNGWYASEVHIFDNPQLRGHVSAGSAKLFWDC